MLSPTDIPARSALLVVDVQRGFVDDDTAAIPGAVVALLDATLERFGLCVASRYVNRPGSPCRLLLESESCAEPPDTELCEGVERPGVIVIEKATYALGEPLTRLLAEHGTETLFLVGVDTHACVLHEALDAFDRGVRPVVLADLCGSTGGARAHDAALDVLRRAIGEHNVWRGVSAPAAAGSAQRT